MSLDVLKANRIAGSVYVEPNETLYDPVSKFRVSTPSNLIDTDFEYGLQSTKWETLELINNIPTFFVRDGEASFPLTAMTAISGSNVVTVTTSEAHGLITGNVIIVKGASLAFADGTYVVLTVPSTTQFTYRAKRSSPITGSVLEGTTEAYLANLYQGTEFRLENLGSIQTDGAATSAITVNTRSPHGFKAGATFILLNSLTSQEISFDSRLVTELNYVEKQASAQLDTPIHVDNAGAEDAVIWEWGTANITDPGSDGMTSVDIVGGEDNGKFSIQFPTGFTFKAFDNRYDRIYVSANSAIFFSNSVDAPTGVPGSIRPAIEIFGNGEDNYFNNNWYLSSLKYQTSTNGLRVRFEGYFSGDVLALPTLIWEIYFDCITDTATFRLYAAPSSGYTWTPNFLIYGPTDTPLLKEISEFADTGVYKYYRELNFRMDTQDSSVIPPFNTGYQNNSLDFDNTNKFNHYYWTGSRTLVFDHNLQGSSSVKPSLWFALGKNTAEAWDTAGVNDVTYIQNIENNVITFSQPHGLIDGRPYLYVPGVANGGLTIAGSQITAPTIYHIRTKATNSGTLTGYSLGDGIYSSITTTATNTTVTTNLITVTSTAAMNVNSPIVFLGTAFGGLVSGKVYFIKTINSATQITVSESLDGAGKAGSTVTLTTATGSLTTYIGAIITDPTRQLILTNRTATTVPLTVNFGVQAAAARFPLATDRYGPHAFLNATRIHFHDVTAAGANGNGYPIAALDATSSIQDVALNSEIPVCIFTATGSGAATAPTGTTASTNNYNNTTSTIYYIRNINSNTLTFGTVGTLVQRQNNYNTTTSNATTTAIALAAETVTLTVPQASLNDAANFITGIIGHEVEFTAPAALVGIRGFVTAHSGTTTRSFTVKLVKPVDVAIGAQSGVVGVQWYGSGSRNLGTFNLSTTPAGAILPLSGVNYESYIVPIVHPNNWTSRQSFYMKNHQFQTNNIVLYENSTTNATAIPTGLTNQTYYRAEVIDVDRFRLLNDAGTAINYTAMAGANAFNTMLKDNSILGGSTETATWLWSIGAVAANGTASTITVPPPAYKNADNVTIPTTSAGVNTFTITSTTRFIGGAGNIAHHGARIKFYNPRVRTEAQMTAGDYPDDDFKLNDGTSINALDIRIGAISGTAPAVSIVCYVMTPGGLPSAITTIATAKAIIETGMSIRDEDQLTGISSWCRDKWLNNRDNAIYPHVGTVFGDLYETSLIPQRQLEQGSVTAVTAADPISVTYTMPSNQVSIVSASRTSNIATITTATPHYFKEGQTVTVASVTDTTFNNASAVIISTTFNTFTYSNAGTNATSSNGTASQLIPAIAPKLATISAFTRALPGVVTTGAAHGLVNSQAFHFQGLLGDWSGLWDGRIYYAKVTAATTFEVYKDPNLTQPVDTTSIASAYAVGTHAGRIWALGAKINPKGVTATFTTRVSDIYSDTIFATGHGLNAGTLVTYSTGGGTAPGGLTAGNQRYVFEPTANNFRLSTTASGWSTAAITVNQSAVNVNTTTGVITTAAPHGFTTGKQVQYLSATPATGLENGAFYWVRNEGASVVTLYWTQNGALNNVATDRVKMLGTATGTATLRQAEIVDITTEGVGTTHKLTTATTIGAIDGLYEVADAAPSGNTSAFTLTNPTGAFIPKRTIAFASVNGVDLFNSAIYSPAHGLVTGTPITYKLGNASTAPADLVDETVYYAIRTNANYFRIALTSTDAANNVYVNINSTVSKAGTGTHEFEVSSIVGATAATGTLSLTAGSKNVIGTNTSFTSYYRSGDHFTWTWVSPSANTTRTFTFSGATCTNTSVAPFNTSHGLLTGMSVIFSSSLTDPVGLVTSNLYYVRYVAANTFQLHPTYNDAINNTNAISPTGGTGTFTLTISYCAESGTEIVDYVNSRSKLVLLNSIPLVDQAKYPVSVSASASTTVTVTFPFAHGLTAGSGVTLTGTGVAALDNVSYLIATTPAVNTLTFTASATVTVAATTAVGQYAYSFPSATFDVTSSLLLRSDSSSVHRPFDGGVEIVSSRTPDSQLIRQTRRYFRYQSGKGIQVSFAINFSPSVMINSVSGLGGGAARVVTRVPHALSNGVQITIFNDTSGNFNSTYTVSNVIDDYTFDISTGYTTSTSSGRPEFYVNSWSDASLRCGLFDDQNGMFFEFDGQTLYCVRRNSTTQLGGTASVEFNSNTVIGSGTNFNGELTAGDMVVIRGQSYKVTEVPNTTTFYIQPAYRGKTATNVVLSKTIDLKVAQSSWNEDPCNGTGPTGYNLNKYAIQMAYMDYSWYGAGKVRFGFKDANGVVRYVHNFIHNNSEREAYLRSGNLPARYEVKTGANPTYVPKLAHWGTSVIMDGGFDDDKAYFFSALSNQINATATAGSAISVTNSQVVQATKYYAYDNGGKLIGEIGFAIQITTASETYKTIASNVSITGAGLATGTTTALPTMGTVNGQSRPYIESVRVSPILSTRVNLLVINQAPAATTAAGQTYTVANPELLAGYIPLLSLRLAPSVDNGVPGGLGSREVINRMQLALKKLDVLSTHEVEISLVFNPTLDNLTWSKVSSPSLSQVVYHSLADTVTGGTQILSFQCPQGSQLATGANTAQRSYALTTIDLADIASLGNSILGGDSVFPDGPDILTLRFRYTGDAAQIGTGAASSSQSPFKLSTRLSWTESQA